MSGLARQGWWPTLASAALAALAITLAPRWAYALSVCGSTISSCCKITNSGIYSVSQNFSATGSPSACIKIQAANVSLNGNSYTITGPGATSAMKGVVIEPGANYSLVETLTVSGFGTGAEVDAKHSGMGYLTATSDGTGVVVNGKNAILVFTSAETNNNNGIVINGKAFSGQMFGGFGNGANGVVFNSSAVGAFAIEPEGSGNAKAGLKIKGVTGGWFQQALAEQNGTYGVWLRGTNAVSLADFTVDSNGIAGVYLGCHGDFPSTATCPAGVPPTNSNNIFYTGGANTSTANGGSSPVQQYGVAIDAGNYLNHVFDISADSNSVDDGYDGNTNCASNVWINNTFTSANQSCVNYVP